MKNENIVKKLEKNGYTVSCNGFGYWDRVPCIIGENNTKFFIVERCVNSINQEYGKWDFKYEEVVNKFKKQQEMIKLLVDKNDYRSEYYLNIGMNSFDYDSEEYDLLQKLRK